MHFIISRRLLIPLLYLITALLIVNCSNRSKELPKNKSTLQKPSIQRDLHEIKSKGVLKAITIYSGTSYFLYKGEPMGFEYELLERYAKDLGVELEIIIAKNLDELFLLLNLGEGDIVAHGMTITEPRKELVDFTEYHYLTHQVLVQKKPDNWRKMKLHEIQRALVSDPVELIGDTVHVRNNSSYHHRLKNLSEEIGGKIIVDTLPGNLATDEIIKMVVDGKIKYTVADNNIASINSAYYPILDVKTPLSFSQRIAWAVRKNSPDLRDNLNNWINEFKSQVDYFVIYDRYFKNTRTNRRRVKSEFFSKNSGKISPYDDIVKKYSEKIGWDWRFVSSLIYQESRFDPKAKSWAGARGLMQLTKSTALEMGVKKVFNPEDNIKGGTRYLLNLWNRWEIIPDSIQRIKFVLASYNAGFNHIMDAKKLAAKFNADSEIWDDNVEVYILKLAYPNYYNDAVVNYGYLRGNETFSYVKEIFNRYDHYKQFIPL